jgi:ABC-type multidrug transport system fused ATPase/permease subunit
MFVRFGLDAPLALILLLSLPFLVLWGGLFAKYGRPAMRSVTAVQSRMNGWLAEHIAGMRENQLSRTEDRRRDEFYALTDAHQAAMTRWIQAWGLLRPAMMLTSTFATCAVLGIGYGRVTTGIITVGVLLTFLQYTTKLWVPVRNLTEKFNMIQTALTSAERIFDVLEVKAQMFNASQADAGLKVERGDVEFSAVRFKYPTKDEEALRGLDFKVSPGQMLALVGDTGAGKSTVAHLVSRFYDVTGGAVSIDGRDVREYTLEALRSGIALVPQDVVIFAGTLRDNITLGLDVDEARLKECVSAVCADRIVARYERGLEHVMEEGGRTLSAGERQLISFARALVFNPPILILDEATANVDTETEALIQRALARLTQGRTSIVIAHRLSTIRDADEILVLRHGQVIERGRHAALLDADGEYARLYRLHTTPATTPGASDDARGV